MNLSEQTQQSIVHNHIRAELYSLMTFLSECTINKGFDRIQWFRFQQAIHLDESEFDLVWFGC